MDWNTILFSNLPVKLVTVLLIWAAYIDGKQLRVPNWLTFPMILSGMAYNTYVGGWGWDGFLMAFVGTIVGIMTLLPLRLVGGMGMGDVKLMAGIGAWLGAIVTWNAFCVSVVVGAIMAILMVLSRRSWDKHYTNFLMILMEFMTIKKPAELYRIAAERKPNMLLLPYGIPICIGSIAYFFYAGMI